MSDRRRTCQQQQQHVRQIFEDKCRSLEDEIKKKTETIEALKKEYVLSNQPKDLSRPKEQSHVRHSSLRSNANSHWNSLTKDREIAKLKALLFQKDNEQIALTTANKNNLSQMEERMERERKVWMEHKELHIAGERAKFEEEKTRSLKDLQDRCKLEQERSQRLEQKLYETQTQLSEAQIMLKESGRERINAVYNSKEQCRKEFQDEITRLRNQFQLEKDGEFLRIQERMQQLEKNLEQSSAENADANLRQQELYLNLEASEKICLRSICDCIKKLFMAMDSPSQVYSTIPTITSLTYDRESLVDRLPTRSVLKLLQETVEDIRNYIAEQKVQIETKVKVSNKAKVLNDRTTDYSNPKLLEENPSNRNSQPKTTCSKHQKENDHYFRDIDRLSDTHHARSHHLFSNPFPLSSEQTDTIDNLVQKLEDHIASELDRLTKQRLTGNGSNHFEAPKKVKFEPISTNTGSEANQDILIRHLQHRISDLQDDNIRLQSKSTF